MSEESYLKQQIEEVKKVQAMTHNMVDYLRVQFRWLLDHCREYNIPLPDIQKAKYHYKTAGEILAQNSPTEFQQRNKTPEDSTEQTLVITYINS